MIILPHSLNDIIEKGEITDRYYNPGNLFDEVHIVLTNNDRPNKNIAQKMVGDAKLYIHNVPTPQHFFLKTLGWNPLLMKPWVRKVIELAQSISPELIRCHGADINAYAAMEIKSKMNIPYAVSLHINPDIDIKNRVKTKKDKIYQFMMRFLQKRVLKNADIILPVYRPIVPFLEKLKLKNYDVCYNVLNPSNLKKKKNYGLRETVKVIYVGRQIDEKNPDNIIRAIRRLKNVEFTIVGDGPIHDYLKKVAKETNNKHSYVTFRTAIPNDELCQMLPNYDICAIHSEYFEISKSVLEILLTGLPLILNKRFGTPVPELTSDICYFVDNTVDSYYEALKDLIENDEKRQELGQRAYHFSRDKWDPTKTEKKYVEVYRTLLKNSSVYLNSRKQNKDIKQIET